MKREIQMNTNKLSYIKMKLFNKYIFHIEMKLFHQYDKYITFIEQKPVYALELLSFRFCFLASFIAFSIIFTQLRTVFIILAGISRCKFIYNLMFYISAKHYIKSYG